MDNITSDNKQSATNTKAHKNKKGLTTNKTIKFQPEKNRQTQNPEPRTQNPERPTRITSFKNIFFDSKRDG